ncbi:MAG TPA: BadF/BadG/BcrA/BcrD ATPase family protein [Longimicrobiales bacterium]
MTSLYIGVDGGGTHARAAVTDESGRELARRTGPAGLVDPREPSNAATVVAQLARAALHDAGAESAAALCCGLAGAGRPQEREAVRVALTLEHVADRVTVVGDAEAAMADAFPGGTGVLVVAGTGSIAWARAREGPPIRVGGWGQILGDEGSAYDIALAALRAVARAHDGRLPDTTLTGALLATLRIASPDDLIAWAASASKAQIAALAPTVLSCAGQGDAVAAAIRSHAVESIMLLAVTAARRAGLESPEIALMGGLIARNGPLRDAVADALRRTLPRCTVIDRTVDAALGAARLARSL